MKEFNAISILKRFSCSFDTAIPQSLFDELVDTARIYKYHKPPRFVFSYECEGILGQLLPIDEESLHLMNISGITLEGKEEWTVADYIHEAIMHRLNREKGK